MNEAGEEGRDGMKILIVRTFPDVLKIDSYNVQEIGLARALTMRGHQCDIVLYNGENEDRTQRYTFEKNGIEYNFDIFWMKGKAFFKNGFMPGVKKLIPDYDVIQVHEYDQIMSWQLYTKPRKPTVLYHGPYQHPYTRGYNLKCKVFDLLFLPWRRRKDVYALTKSELAADFLKGKGFEKVIPVGVGINVDNFTRKFEEVCKIDADINRLQDSALSNSALTKTVVKEKEIERNKFRILYVGKIEERRNVYFLIDVFRKLQGMYGNLELVLIGDGEKEYKEAFLESIKAELESGTITHITKLAQNELPAYYASSDMFLFTTNYDIFGMVLLEAMYYGLPVVSTMNGGASMLIRNDVNGYVLDEFDLKMWTEKISGLIQDADKRKQMGMVAHQTIEEGFTWESMAEKFETVYEKAIQDY